MNKDVVRGAIAWVLALAMVKISESVAMLMAYWLAGLAFTAALLALYYLVLASYFWGQRARKSAGMK